jgi:uncharacterized protein YbjT (DUF2867 family)
MDTRTAIVFGATGLVGTALLGELSNSSGYGMVRIFTRKKTTFSDNEKVKEFIIDFNRLKDFAELIKGDDLFICLGTTIKKAGSVSRMEEIDCGLPLEIAALASVNGVEKIAVVSSLGADSGSSNYYLRIKGEMEKGVMKLNFRTIVIMRPSILFGERTEKRFGEELGKAFMRISGVFLIGRLAKYRGIEGSKVARAMVKAINEKTGTQILESDMIQKIAGNN